MCVGAFSLMDSFSVMVKSILGVKSQSWRRGREGRVRVVVGRAVQRSWRGKKAGKGSIGKERRLYFKDEYYYITKQSFQFFLNYF